MKTATLCFSVFKFSRTAIPRFTDIICKGSFHGYSSSCRNHSNFKTLSSSEGGYSRRWIRRSVSTERGNKSTKKSTDFRNEVLEETISSAAAITTDLSISETHKIEYFDLQQKISMNKKLVTLIVFDIETTGFSRENERIIEIAFQDLEGGENSTFQTLVNPQRFVANSHIHGITTHMVNRPEVPRYFLLFIAILPFRFADKVIYMIGYLLYSSG